MSKFAARIRTFLARRWASFSFVGLALAALFFAASLSPSLLPRHFAVQGVLSGLAWAAGYGLGVLCVWCGAFLEMPVPRASMQRIAKWLIGAAVLAVVASFLWRATVWQNSIRERMEMPPVESAYPWRIAVIAAVTGLLLLTAARLLGGGWLWVHRKLSALMPRRLSYALSTVVVALAVFIVVNHVFLRLAFDAADALFVRLDRIVDDGIEPPTARTASGSAASLVEWDSIGRYGKQFVAAGPTRESIGGFWRRDVEAPLRVYVGLGSRETVRERAELALAELERVGGFDRSVLVVATPTGTGWLDPGAVDTLEYLHAGDTAIVTLQYSYLPSWLTLLVDPARSRDSATVLFDVVYDHWKKLPRESRPRLYVHGLSLGALGSAASADLFTVFEDPIQGGLWSGPPFASAVWARATRYRNAGSPMWLPRFRDGSMLRFTGRECSLTVGDRRWGPMRFVFIQHASDPMTFFSPDLLYQRPAWFDEPRGPDVSPYLQWLPLVTFLQIGFDLPVATAVPDGYGHNIAPSSYIDAWIAVTAPSDWSEEATKRLKEEFACETQVKPSATPP